MRKYLLTADYADERGYKMKTMKADLIDKELSSRENSSDYVRAKPFEAATFPIIRVIRFIRG